MAQIKAYDAGNLKLQPTEIGVESTAAAGRRVGTFYNQLGAGEQELGRDQARLGAETGQLGREAGQFSRELGHETAQLGTAKARALTSWGQGVGSGIAAGGEAAINWQTHREVNTGAKAFADFGLAKTRELNDTLTNAAPNDPGIAQRFMDGLEPDLQKLKDGFTTDKGQQWAEAHIDSMRQSFQAQVMAGTNVLAKRDFSNNSRGTVNSLSAQVYEGAPLDKKIAELESGLVAGIATSPNLKGADAGTFLSDQMQKGVESLVKSSALGHISRTGEVPDWLSDPKYSKYVNAAELQTFAKTAQAYQRSNIAQQKASALYTRQQNNEQATSDVNRVWTDNVKVDDVTGQPSIKPDYFKNIMEAIKNNPDAPNAGQLGRTYLNWGESQLKKQTQMSDPELRQQLMDRIGDPDNPLKISDLMNAQITGQTSGRGLSNKDFGLMKGLISQLDKDTFRDAAYKNASDAAKSLLGTDAVGKGKYADFQASFMPQYAQAKRAGTLPPNALDTTDPKSMISQAMNPYRRDLGQMMTDKIMRGTNMAPAAAPAAAPGVPAVGDTRNGWRFNGGDPAKSSSWSRVQAAQ